MGQERLESLSVGDLLLRRRLCWPASNGVKTPGTNEIGLCLFGIGLLKSIGFRQVGVGCGHKSPSPLVLIARLNMFKSCAHIVAIKTYERIASHLSAVNSLNLDFVQRSLFLFLRPDKRRNDLVHL